MAGRDDIGSFVSPPPRGQGGGCGYAGCACGAAAIPRGEGFLWVTQECCDREGAPALVCRSAATALGLSLEVAASDAERWWSTGRVLRRPTPRTEPPRPAAPAAPAARPAPVERPTPTTGPLPFVVALGTAIGCGFLGRELGQTMCFLVANANGRDDGMVTAHVAALAKSQDAVGPCAVVGAIAGLMVTAFLFDRGLRILAPILGALSAAVASTVLGAVIGFQ